MPDVNSLQVFFFELKLKLLVAKLSTQTLLFLIEVQEDLDVSVKFSFLFALDNLLNFTSFRHLLFELEKVLFLLTVHFNFDFLLESSELLCFLLNMLMHSKFHFIEVLLLNLPCLVHS